MWRARDTRLGRDVAIKVVRPGLASDPDRLSRFEKEARAAAQLDHPNILVVHDVGTHEGSPFIVSELLQGESLREKLGTPLPSKGLRPGHEDSADLWSARASACRKSHYTPTTRRNSAFLSHVRYNSNEGSQEVATDEDLLRIIRERSAANDSVVYAHRVYAETAALAARYGLAAPRSVLELGPGVNLGALFCYVASGVERAVAVDVATLPAPSDGFYEHLRAYLLAIEGFVWWRAWVDDLAGAASAPSIESFPLPAQILGRIEHLAGVSSEALPFADADFDLVYSVAALEHVLHPAGTVAELWRVLRPGGLAVHEIDLKHHGSSDPLKFLEWDEREWSERARPYGADLALDAILGRRYTGEVFCNRLRQSDWLDLFTRAGFVVEAIEPIILLNPDRVRAERFAAPFRTRPLGDLRPITVRITARRPPDG